ncbi:MAG: sulfite exporter TauE/SafE family protein [Oculatellaceae cyanobacterium bins.114]|nr:sulfite exporter TauE/SafE family protein [Oculatellaceae cyanobacterium bins.114]
MDELIISSIVMLAAIAQSFTGFGFSLVAIALLPSVISIKLAVPFVALFSAISNGTLWFYHRHHFDHIVVLQLSIAAIMAMPLGIVVLHYISDKTALQSLGILLISYVIYNYFHFKLPNLKSPQWVYIFGGLSGFLTGAYNTGGPPAVIYGTCKHWTPEEFKGNLPCFFLISSTVAIAGHAFQGNLSVTIWTLALVSIPGFLLGLAIGTLISNHLKPSLFKHVVLGLLLLMGLRLISR